MVRHVQTGLDLSETAGRFIWFILLGKWFIVIPFAFSQPIKLKDSLTSDFSKIRWRIILFSGMKIEFQGFKKWRLTFLDTCIQACWTMHEFSQDRRRGLRYSMGSTVLKRAHNGSLKHFKPIRSNYMALQLDPSSLIHQMYYFPKWYSLNHAVSTQQHLLFTQTAFVNGHVVLFFAEMNKMKDLMVLCCFGKIMLRWKNKIVGSRLAREYSTCFSLIF